MKEAFEEIALFSAFVFVTACIAAIGLKTIGSCVMYCQFWDLVAVCAAVIIFFWGLIWLIGYLLAKAGKILNKKK